MNRFIIAHNAPRSENALTDGQERAIIRLVDVVGLDHYRWLKRGLKIPEGVTIPQLTRSQASRLIERMARFTP